MVGILRTRVATLSLGLVGARGNFWGLKKVVRYSIWISIVSTLIFLVSIDVWMLYAARILEGVAYGVFTGTAVAFLIKNTPPNKIGTAVKLSGITVLIGFGLGPAISGLIVQYVHFQPLRLPYWVLLIMLISSLVILEMRCYQSTMIPIRKPGSKAKAGPYCGSAILLIFRETGSTLGETPRVKK
ncbi:MFS transporter [Peribacillus simplex]